MYAFRNARENKDATQKLDLRDAAGDRIIASRRAAARTSITEPLLRREVGRDLEALVNSVALESTEDLSDLSFVRRSILNYGLPDIVHRSIDEAGVASINQEIETALRLYEPRLVAGTVRVSRDVGLDPADLKVRFIVSADLLCKPVNVAVQFIADVEFDSGAIRIKQA